LTRALGTEEKVQVDVSEYPIFAGDILIIASDGLTKMIEDPRIEQIAKEAGEPKKITERLIAEALSAGGLDNVTVVTVRFLAPKSGGIKGLIGQVFGKK
jgi:protein phosphatase